MTFYKRVIYEKKKKEKKTRQAIMTSCTLKIKQNNYVYFTYNN